MALYSLAVRTTGVGATIGSIAAGLSPAATDRVRVLEMLVVNATATQLELALVRATTAGTATTPVLGQAQDPADAAATAGVALAYSAAPAIGTVYLERIVLPATVGAGITIAWALNELMAINAGPLLLVNARAVALTAMDVRFRWEE